MRDLVWRGILTGSLIVAVTCAVLFKSAPAAFAAGTSWSTYLFNDGRAGVNSADPINATNASRLKEHWAHHASGSIVSQPVVSASLGLVFWGSWDGYEHATKISNNAFAWGTFLGQTSDSSCVPSVAGVSGAATIGAIGSTPVVFVGGGNDTFYALNATTGHIIWQTRLGSSPSHYIWSSPAVYNGSVYIAHSSFGDCPLVAGQLFMLNATTGAMQHTLTTVPSGCTGAGIWGSPAIDDAAGYVYFATGNPGNCGASEPLAEAVVKVNASALAYTNSWQLRSSDGADLDFGTTPTLFQTTINGVTRKLIGIGNKDGVYYALDRNALRNGPVWKDRVANSGDCPQCGGGTISPSAWDGTSLYVAGGNTTINGTACAGSLRALNPATGGFRWQHCLNDGPVLGAVSVAGSPGVAFVGEGKYLMGIATANGQALFRFADTASGSTFWGGSAISGGVVYSGNVDGNLYAIGF